MDTTFLSTGALIPLCILTLGLLAGAIEFVRTTPGAQRHRP